MPIKINFIAALFLLLQLGLSNARVMSVIGEKIYECQDFPKKQLITAIDFTNLKIHQENDTHTYINGSMKFVYGFARLPARIYIEQYVRGKWIIQLYDRTFYDMCVTFHNPAEIFYNHTNHFPPCPIKSGTDWHFDMVHIRGSDRLKENFPSYLTGLWRITFVLDFNVDGEYKKNCKQVHADIFEA